MNPKYAEILKFVNNDPDTLSLLYDLDFMPEQLEEDSKSWIKMLIIAHHMRSIKRESIKSTVDKASLI